MLSIPASSGIVMTVFVADLKDAAARANGCRLDRHGQLDWVADVKRADDARFYGVGYAVTNRSAAPTSA
jgi:hypothetical protein